MKIPSSALFSVVLMATTLGAMGIPTVNVTVMNFPLDEQGNLKVSSSSAESSWKTIRVVENFNLTWIPDWGDVWTNLIDVGLVEIGGYSRMKLYVQVTNYTLMNQGSSNYATARISFASHHDFIETQIHTNVWVGWNYQTTAGQKLFGQYPNSYGEIATTHEQSVRVFIQGMSSTMSGPLPPTVTCLVTVGIYLRNE